ncbi:MULTISPECIES: glucose-6-phosphate isomerase [unclassified Colwellia]|jgi:glucose-6-phosphate isomerase|uniref:glucose-6-phosphate isomerase n=1 Tax=unclassified Colwellia TaxID=196834 RepID=UPI000D33DA9A|nr:MULTISPECIES: glucose-6-phosphate isomerase [unclassified Colwellia]AWB58236.1 glucose-6-phosphate isomerase [Colwellia sp. Arc7-D]MBA6415274.1 glucose-6-phosphate isomerase [Colwellia sp. 6M3]|tara:strand:- start:1127 stop:2767 length:1641 start_codon:yes stop_codon:yes gene_type:complete
MLTNSLAWQNLQIHYLDSKTIHLKSLFRIDPERFDKFTITASGLTLDYSKNHLVPETKKLLVDLAEQCGVKEKIEQMFSGAPINTTENRPVLHTALRNFSDEPVYVDGENIMPLVKGTLEKIKTFVNDVSSGATKGYSGKAFTDIVAIGIGGSFLGPKIMSEALKPYRQKHLNVHYVANVDGCHIHDVLSTLDPETTLVITSSKTLTTQETLRNTESAKEWFLKQAKVTDIEHNFACVSSNIKAAKSFGINEKNIFPMWDWVGGRYSIWSAIGLPLAIGIGYDNYLAFLNGAFEMDEHFRQAPYEENMPVIMALLGVWYRNFHGAQSQVLLPYYHYLRGLPAYIQQLDMESNGKSVNLDNHETNYDTGPIIWGSEGTNGQHSFHQLIHQSKTPIPVDFILPLNPHVDISDHHDMLIANCLGQSQALMEGQSQEQVIAAMTKAKCSTDEISYLSSHKVMKGNKPSNTLLMPKLTPKALGSLIALYEHKVFVQGVIWQINSFDQWGVELGKALGNEIFSKLSNIDMPLNMDGSTKGLINICRKRRTIS